MAKNELSLAKRALLEKWRKGQFKEDRLTVTSRPSDSPIRLSFPQQRQLFLELLDRDTAVNNLSVFIELAGQLDVSVLEQSANQIFDRHEVLRTQYSFGQGMPVPQVLSEYSFKLPIIDLQEYTFNEQEEKACELAEQEVLKPFNLAQAPLIRLQLYLLSNQK